MPGARIGRSGALQTGSPSYLDAVLGGSRAAGTVAATAIRSTRKDAGTIVSGSLYVSRAINVIPAGVTITSVKCVSGNLAAVAPTNQWVCLIDNETDRNVLAKSVDKLTEAWVLDTEKTFTFSPAYTTTAPVQPYFGIVVAAGTVPNIMGDLHARAAVTKSTPGNPMLCGTSTTGLTDPTSLGATAAAFVLGAVVLYYYAS